MAFPGIWMTQNEWLLYRVVPKAAYSSIGQILFYIEHGAFFERDIHDAQAGIHEWAMEHPLCQGSCPLLYFSLIFRWAG